MIILYIIILLQYLKYVKKDLNSGFCISPTFLMLSTFVLLYVVPEFLNFLYDFNLRKSFFIEKHEFLYHFSVIISFFSLLGGIHLSKKRQQKKRTILFEKYVSLSRGAFLLANLFLLLGVYAGFKSLQNMGDIYSVLFSTRFGGDYIEARIMGENSGIIGVLVWLIPINLAYIYIYIQYRFRSVIIGFLYKSLIFLIPVSIFLLLTVRHNLISLIILIFYYFLFTNYKFAKKAFYLFPILFVVIIFMQGIRVSGIEKVESKESIEFFLESLEHKNVTHKIINDVSRKGFTYFEHIGDVFVFLVPRAVWADKPIGGYLNNHHFPEVARIGSEKAIGIVGEGYSAFGLVGVFLLSGLLGYVIYSVQLKISEEPDLVKKLFWAAIIIPLSYFSIRSNMFGKHLINSLLVLLNIFIISKFQSWHIKLNEKNSN
ncbi:MAG: oligosaccharide repeat unit polymerase [Melioribacteraceae bacterium]|nr:oligosaccharide repeat unit polymerase [Melioribacteraceae bacterium]